MVSKERLSIWLRGILIFAIVLGVIFRFVNLNHKVYSHDEVYTSLRAAGYTHAEVDQELFQNRLWPVKALQRFQQIKPGSTAIDTVRSLAGENPQHPPLYFLLTRFWMQGLDQTLKTLFHSSLTTMRSLPALLSLLSLPLIYTLAWDLFGSRRIALLATTFLAISPFDILFAQTARQYSLLTVLVIASYILLRRALWQQQESERKHAIRNWGLYGLTVAVGLYTHPFFGLTVVAQAIYLGLVAWREQWPRTTLRRSLLGFAGAGAGAIGLYAPWLWVLLTNFQQTKVTTSWNQVFPGIDYLAKLWLLSFTSLFFDLDFGFTNPVTFLWRVPILVLLGVALYTLWQRTRPAVWLCVVTAIVVPFLLLAVPDLLLGGKRSAVSRYLISCYPGVQLAIAALLAPKVFPPQQSIQPKNLTEDQPPLTVAPRYPWLWRGVLAFLLVGSLVSCTASGLAFTWWNKDLSYFNAEISHTVNAMPSAVVVSDHGDDYTNTGDLISLSYLLKSEVQLLLVDPTSNEIRQGQWQQQLQGARAIMFHPSQTLYQVLEQQGTLQLILPEGHLWQFTPTNP